MTSGQSSKCAFSKENCPLPVILLHVGTTCTTINTIELAIHEPRFVQYVSCGRHVFVLIISLWILSLFKVWNNNQSKTVEVGR